MRLLKSFVREIASSTPYLRNRYFEWEFLRRLQSYKGIYASFAAARAESFSGRLSGYNHKEVARDYQVGLENLNPADYPVLFWLSPLLPHAKLIFDLGGNLGVGYYAYRKYLSFPTGLRWVVCEVPETVVAGRQVAAERRETQIAFTDDREPDGEVDVYFTAGALQYIEEPFHEIISKLRHRPRHLLIQRVPLCGGPSFITLQNNGRWIVPYRVTNESEFIQSISSLGYEMIDHWKITRSLQVLGNPEHQAENYHGMYFRWR